MRQLFDHEQPIVAYLFDVASIPLMIESIWVEPMHDGGMGSLAIAPVDSERKFGSIAAECQFQDADGVLVSVALNLDTNGLPLEVDVWRVDFSPIQRWPLREEITAM